jgi:hypothetical protein
MQEKEMTRTDTATLSQWARDLSGYFAEDAPIQKQLLEIADRLEEQEDTIRHLRTELCNASAVAMGHAEAVRTFREELDLLNKRPKR